MRATLEFWSNGHIPSDDIPAATQNLFNLFNRSVTAYLEDALNKIGEPKDGKTEKELLLAEYYIKACQEDSEFISKMIDTLKVEVL